VCRGCAAGSESTPLAYLWADSLLVLRPPESGALGEVGGVLLKPSHGWLRGDPPKWYYLDSAQVSQGPATWRALTGELPRWLPCRSSL